MPRAPDPRRSYDVLRCGTSKSRRLRGSLRLRGVSQLTLDQKEAIGKLTRQALVIGIYRWLIEVVFLFAAFTEFPEHKWSVGLAVLAFSAAISAVVHVQQTSHAVANVMMDQGERKTRHAILLAGELAGKSVGQIDERSFWDQVDGRVEAEATRLGNPDAKPTGFWKGTLLAMGALLWQLAASLFGIALVATLTA